MEFTIYRDSWRRGGDGPELAGIFGATMLLHPQSQMMCCLGQCALQMGAKPEDIEGIGEPCDVGPKDILEGVMVRRDEDDFEAPGYYATKLTREAMGINDSDEIEDDVREIWLATLFNQEQGHTLIFVDGSNPNI